MSIDKYLKESGRWQLGNGSVVTQHVAQLPVHQGGSTRVGETSVFSFVREEVAVSILHPPELFH